MPSRSTPQSSLTSFAADHDRRRQGRHPGRAIAEIVRANDALRQGRRVELADVSMSGIGVVSSDTLQPGERVNIRLQNAVQRFRKEVPGIVRWTIPLEGGTWRVGVELTKSLSALDLQMLKRAGVAVDGQTGRTWV